MPQFHQNAKNGLRLVNLLFFTKLKQHLTLAFLLMLCLFCNLSWAAPQDPLHKKAAAHSQGKKVHKTVQKSKTKSVAQPLATEAYSNSAAAMDWSDAFAQRHQIDRQWARSTIGQARKIPAIIQYVMPPATPSAKNWRAYRNRFIEPIRIQAGLRFWKSHEALLARAEQAYGVPAEIIVGIIGVETLYGQNTGNFKVIDALATLAFDFPVQHPRATERQAYFSGELEQFLLLAQANRWDPLVIKGSYAGAMGWPQFMPGSWAKFAVDFDGDNRIDLYNSPADVIGSVANYFKAFNWQTGMPTHYPVQFDATRLNMEALMAPDILPTFSISSFMAKGALLDGAALQHSGPLALIELQNGGDAPTYVAGTENFYAITRYNWSSYYAMAVIELGQEIKAARQR
jgi:membrane-bound lytic murein transglycosylase B